MSYPQNTPGMDASFDLAQRLVADEALLDRYPNRTSIIAADHPQFSSLVEAAISEGHPIAVVWPDGSDMVWRPRERTNGLGLVVTLLGLWLLKLGDRRRTNDRPLFVPEHWVAEFHRAPESHPAQPVG